MLGENTDDRGALEQKDAEEISFFDEAWDSANDDKVATGQEDDVVIEDNKDSKEDTAETMPEPDTTKVGTNPNLQQPDESEEKFEQRYKTLQGIHKHDKETWGEEKARLLTELEEAKKPKAPEAMPSSTLEEKEQKKAFIDSLTDEQKEQLEEYDREFDLVSKMEGIKRSIELNKLRQEIEEWKSEVLSKLTEQETQFTEKLTPALTMAEEIEQKNHFNLIRTGYVLENGTKVQGHDDFEKYRDDGSLLAWIESKPKYLQPALMSTYSNGAAIDVIDLITDFKRDNNIKLDALSENIIPINATKEAKKQALSSVTSGRVSVNPSVADNSDYDSAWNDAIRK